MLVLMLSLAHAGRDELMAEFGTVDPRRLEVALTLDPANPAYSGVSVITLSHTRPVEELVVHAAEGVVLGDVTFVQRGRRVPGTATAGEGETWTLRPAEPIQVPGLQLPRKKAAQRGESLFADPGILAVEIPFTNTVNDQAYGLYRFEHDGKPYLVTQFEADDAREAFPCIDLPSAKIDLWLTLTVPKDLVALGNAPVRSETVDEEAGTRTVVFEPTRKLPTYAMALGVGPYTRVPIPGMPDHAAGFVYTVAGREDLAVPLAAEIAPLLEAHERWFGSRYPYRKLDVLAVPEFAYGGMENPGLIVITDQMLAPADQRTPGTRRAQQEVMSHEIAHMWFGDLVTLAWWDDFWLNESFAEWAGGRIAHEVSQDIGFAYAKVATSQYALGADGRGTMRPVRTEVDPTRIFETTNFLAYPKGEALLAMVEAWLGPAVFQRGVRAYLTAHTDGNATSADLFAALGEASGKDVAGMMAPWLDRPGAPLIRLEPGSDGKVTYTQSRYLAVGAEAERAQHWTVPMSVKWADDAGVHTQVVVVDAAAGDFTLPVQGALRWLLPVADGHGYFAWTLPEPALVALMAAAPTLTGPERSALVGNLGLIMGGGEIRDGQLLAWLRQFAAETEPKVMQRVLSAQGFVDQVLRDEDRDAWAAYVRATRRPWLDRLGLAPVEGEDESIPELRGRLIGELIDAGRDETLKDQLVPYGERFLADEAAFDPNLTGLGLRLLAERSEPALQDTLLAKAHATQNPMFRGLYLSAFAQVPGAAQQERALTLALAPDTSMSDLFPLLSALPDETEAEKDAQLEWIITHHDALAAKLPPQYRSALAGVGSGCNEARWARSTAFFSAPERSGPGMDRMLAEGAEALAMCQAARARSQLDLQ